MITNGHQEDLRLDLGMPGHQEMLDPPAHRDLEALEEIEDLPVPLVHQDLRDPLEAVHLDLLDHLVHLDHRAEEAVHLDHPDHLARLALLEEAAAHQALRGPLDLKVPLEIEEEEARWDLLELEDLVHPALRGLLEE